MGFGFLSSFLNSNNKDLGNAGPRASCVSGGEARDDGRVAFGYSLMRGKRGTMEDVYFGQFRKETKTGETVGLFGVFDGHGGSACADYVRNNLFANMMQHAKFTSDPVTAIIESYEATDNAYCNPVNNRDDGCTAVTAVVMGGRLYMANAGDSRAVLCRNGRAVQVSVDHKPNAKDERQRVEGQGGIVVWAGTWRVGGVLAVSRAFGDKPLKRYVIATPDVRDEKLAGDEEFLILASDGLWDVCMNQDACDLIRDIANPEAAAKRLAQEAYDRGSNDNITVLIVRFRP